MTRELIKQGENGSFCMEDSEHLSNCILNLIGNPEELIRRGDKAWEMLQPKYVQQYCMDQLESVLGNQIGCF